jgi:hypothetical protein
MAIKLAELNTVIAAAAVIYKSVYFYSSLYSTNAYQHTHLLGLKFYIKAVQPSTKGGIEE